MPSSIKFKIISALNKCFYDDNIDDLSAISSVSLLKNEVASFQVAYFDTKPDNDLNFADVCIEGDLKDCITVNQVVCVPSAYPASLHDMDDNYLRTAPGLYPDLITSLDYNNRATLISGNLRTLWFDITPNDSIKGGSYKTKISLKLADGFVLGEGEITINVIDALLPDYDIYHSEWFYCDCLSQYYGVEVFSQKHFQIIENFLQAAAKNGISSTLIPVFTPALDTYVGGERLTTQLVKITCNDGIYSFDFSLFERYINMCKKCGIKYFEIPHFYTQWGAKAAPKFMAEVDGEYKKIFGWETDSTGAEYVEFLDVFIPALLKELNRLGIAKNAIFHVSDEPEPQHFDHYNIVSKNILKHLDGYTVIDAVGNVDIYTRGIVKHPAVILSAVDDFLKAGAKDDMIAYYCNQPRKTYTNRFLSMPTARTRILGVQLYTSGINGFMHWGYNYYNTRFSYNTVNPYLDTTGAYFAPSGDMFLVYPGADGKPEDTIRLKAMRDAFYDLRALKYLESLTSREYVLSLVQEGLDYDLTFSEYPKDAEYLLNLRLKVNEAIRNNK